MKLFYAFVNIPPTYWELAHVYWFLYRHVLPHLIYLVVLNTHEKNKIQSNEIYAWVEYGIDQLK